jgi:uncharacterized damage-inducible protein DinB
VIASLAKRFARLEDARSELARELTCLSVQQQTFRPAPGAWSVAEVVDHIVRVEAAILEGASKPGVNRTDWKARPARLVLTWAVFTLGLRIRVPERVKHVTPSADAALDDALRRWGEVRERMREFLAQLTPEQLGQLAIKHPIAGPFSYRDFLAFPEWHLRHHRRQIARIRRAPGFPG